MVNIAVLGYGVVGSGVVEVFRKNSMSIAKRAGEDITVKKILDIRDFPESPDSELLTKNADEVFDDPAIEIIVETIGGIGIAHEFTKRAFSAGKHVVTSNKELVATHGPELLKLAEENGVNYLFEASVGGGIPIIRPLHQCLSANEIHGITGILNGTTNYILTSMKRDGADFETALKTAQLNGYAESDPTADIGGHDACRKIAILSSIAFNEFVDYKNIYTEGIGNITLADMYYAEVMNSVIKLIAMSTRVENKVFARVSPAMVSKTHPLANVEDVFNAIVVKGDAIGDAMFYGRGAGKLPTASAVAADVIDIASNRGSRRCGMWERKKSSNMMDIDNMQVVLFVRVGINDKEAAKNIIDNVFGNVRFLYSDKPELTNELAFVTSRETEGINMQKLNILKENSSIDKVINIIRVEEE